MEANPSRRGGPWGPAILYANRVCTGAAAAMGLAFCLCEDAAFRRKITELAAALRAILPGRPPDKSAPERNGSRIPLARPWADND